MATERVTVTLDHAALVAARSAAGAAGESLSEWLSHAAWTRAIEQAASASAAQDRKHPAEWGEWDAARLDRIIGDST